MKQLTMIVALLFAGIATADDHVDPATKAIYDRSCGFCHVSGAAGAPKTGDAAAWESRMALAGVPLGVFVSQNTTLRL